MITADRSQHRLARSGVSVWVTLVALVAALLAVPVGLAEGLDGGSISGVVVEHVESGTPPPLEGVLVEVVGSSYGSHTFTGPDGSYVVEGLPEGTYRVRFRPFDNLHVYEWWDGDRFYDSADDVSVFSGVETQNISADLWVGGSISGVVNGAGGVPLEGASVSVYNASEFYYFGTVLTGSDGSFTFGGLAEGTYRVQFYMPDQVHLSEWYQDQPVFESATVVEVGLGVPTTVDPVTLEVGGWIAGTIITDEGGVPLEGAYAIARDVLGNQWQASTGPDGRYEIRPLAAGSYKVYFEPDNGIHVAEWYDNQPDFGSAAEVLVQSGEGRIANASVGTPNVATTGSMAGTVSDTDGPIEGVTVHVYGWVWSSWPPSVVSMSTVTDSDGGFELTPLPPAHYMVTFSSDSHAREYYEDKYVNSEHTPVQVLAGQTTHIEPVLAVGGSVRGTVREAGSGSPIPGVTVNALVCEDCRNNVLEALAYDVTDEQGNYSFDHIPAGQPFRLHFQAFTEEAGPTSNHAPAWYGAAAGDWDGETAEQLVVSDGADRVNGDMFLAVGGTVTGIVTSRVDGSPLAGVWVGLARPSDVSDYGMQGTGSGFTNEFGVYVIDSLPAGSFVMKFEPWEHPDLVAEYWNNRRTHEDADLVDVSSGVVTQIDVVLDDGISRPVGAESTTTSGVEATDSDPAIVSVTTPISGTLVIVEGDTGQGADGYVLFGQSFDLAFTGYGEGVTPENPFVLVFTVDASLVPGGTDIGEVVVFRDGTPVGECPNSAVASPNPCVSARAVLDGDFEFTVLTTAMSLWSFGTESGSPETTATGFYAPVDMDGVWNIVRGGATVPLKFEVFQGTTELTDPGVVSLAVFEVSCDSGEDSDELEYTTTGETSLRYDATAGQFIQNWKTPKPPGTCWRVTMTPEGGAPRTAFFRLK